MPRVAALGYHMVAGAIIVIVGVGCAGTPDAQPPEPSEEAATRPPSEDSASADPLASPTTEGLFEVAEDGRKLNLTCWGDGAVTVVLEAGHPDGTGVADFGATEFARTLAEDTRVCAYDRAGWGESDPAPEEPRTADDVVDDLEGLLTAADVPGPYVLVGSSFGGMIVSHYAQEHPDDVQGVVLLDVPAPSATLSAEEIPEIAWDHPANPEHVDVGPEFENRFAKDLPSFDAPLTVVTASAGDSSVEDQQTWLDASSESTQVELEGGHEIYLDAPAEVAAEVRQLVEGAE